MEVGGAQGIESGLKEKTWLLPDLLGEGALGGQAAWKLRQELMLQL